MQKVARRAASGSRASSRRLERDSPQLHQLVGSLRDGIVLLDPDGSILSANAAALSLYGVPAVSDLGADFAAFRERFRIAPRESGRADEDFGFARALAGEPHGPILANATTPDDSNGSRVHLIHLHLIADESDIPDFLVLVVEDETARFEAEDRFERAFNANPAPALICRLSDLSFVRVNRGFLEMTGYREDDVIGRSAREIGVLTGPRKSETERLLREGRTIPQGEIDLPLPGGDRRVLIAGQPIEISDESYMFLTFADLEPRQAAERALRQSEERFSKAFALSPLATALSHREDLRFIEVNAAFSRLSGYTPEQLVGRPGFEHPLWKAPEARRAFDAALGGAGAAARGVDLRLRAADGAWIDCLLSAERISVDDKDCVLSVLQDVTELKRGEAELVEAVEAAMSDASWFSAKILEKLAALRKGASERPGAPGTGEVDSLSGREREVLELICEGLADREIAGILNLSPHTVRNHVGSLYRKIGVGRRSAAVVWARERGILGRAARRRTGPPDRTRRREPERR